MSQYNYDRRNLDHQQTGYVNNHLRSPSPQKKAAVSPTRHRGRSPDKVGVKVASPTREVHAQRMKVKDSVPRQNIKVYKKDDNNKVKDTQADNILKVSKLTYQYNEVPLKAYMTADYAHHTNL